MTKNLELQKDKRKIYCQPTNLHHWQVAHIEKGIEATNKSDFASDKEAANFFKKYGKAPRSELRP